MRFVARLYNLVPLYRSDVPFKSHYNFSFHSFCIESAQKLGLLRFYGRKLKYVSFIDSKRQLIKPKHTFAQIGPPVTRFGRDSEKKFKRRHAWPALIDQTSSLLEMPSLIRSEPNWTHFCARCHRLPRWSPICSSFD